MTHYETAVMRMAYDRLSKQPVLQAEAIARHYAALAKSAVHLLALIESKRRCPPSPNCDAVIEHLVQEIKRRHRCDFGLELEWNKKPVGDVLVPENL